MKFFSTGIFIEAEEADRLTMFITVYPGKKLHMPIFITSLQWRVLKHTVGTGSNVDWEEHEGHVAFKLYRDRTSMDRSHFREVRLNIPSGDNSDVPSMN